MKTILKREFFRRPTLVRSLKPGEQVAVTDRGHTDFVVVKSGRRPQRTTAELERLAAQLLPGNRRRINVVEKLRRLRS